MTSTDIRTWQCLRCDVWNDPGHIACQVCETSQRLAIDATTLHPLSTIRAPKPTQPRRTSAAISHTRPPVPTAPPIEFYPPPAAPPIPPTRHHPGAFGPPGPAPYRPPVYGPPRFPPGPPPRHQLSGGNKVFAIIAVAFFGFYILMFLIAALSGN